MPPTDTTAAERRYNGARLHQGIGYVCPDDEHEGRREAIRKAREAGLEQARLRRLARHRARREDTTTQGPTMLRDSPGIYIAKSDTPQATTGRRR